MRIDRLGQVHLSQAAAIAVVLLAASALVPAFALGDEPARGGLLVPGDHHLPGAAFEITGYDLDPGEPLTFELVVGTTSAELGGATVGADGSLATSAVVPAGFPHGYAEVVGIGRAGSEWKTVVLIGERPEGPASQPVADEWTADRIAGVAMVAIGIVVVIAIAAVVIRDRQAPGVAEKND